MAMREKFITIVTRRPEELGAYFGFGWHEIERGRNQFDDCVVVAQGPGEHADWQAMRLGSGLHGARVCDDQKQLDEWKHEWGYKTDEREAAHD